MLGVGQECGQGGYFEGGLPDSEAACWLRAPEILIMVAFSSFVSENVNLECPISAPACGAEHFNTPLYGSLTLVPSESEFMTFVQFALPTALLICRFLPCPGRASSWSLCSCTVSWEAS